VVRWEAPLLVAYGIRYDGRREVMGHMKAMAEKAWDTCLSEAKEIYRQPTRKKATKRYFKWN
jgi:transposase-like protein